MSYNAPFKDVWNKSHAVWLGNYLCFLAIEPNSEDIMRIAINFTNHHYSRKENISVNKIYKYLQNR